jgi:hypothetical protein
MRTLIVIAAALVAASPALVSCSSDSGGSSSGGPTSIHITIKGGKVTPNGDRVKATVDKPITLHIDADSSGEIHVHSTPEQEIEFPKGTSTKKLTIKQPGIIDVEDHKLNQVIVQLQVEQ